VPISKWSAAFKVTLIKGPCQSATLRSAWAAQAEVAFRAAAVADGRKVRSDVSIFAELHEFAYEKVAYPFSEEWPATLEQLAEARFMVGGFDPSV